MIIPVSWVACSEQYRRAEVVGGRHEASTRAVTTGFDRGTTRPHDGSAMESFDAPAARLAAFGDQLTETHDWLRAELARLDGDPRPGNLRAHCLTFCAALERHHTGEDDGAFPALAGRHPDLAPVLDRLREDHRLVAGILRRLRELVESPGDDPRRVRGELDGLKAIMESHFRYEERSIVEALNALDNRQWTAEPPAFLRTDHDTSR